jgi:hypothetical protein
MDARLLELWLRMSADAVRGADSAQQAMGALGQSPVSPAALASWMQMWLPEAREKDPPPVSAADASTFQKMVEDWWRHLGVAPRHQYDELRTRYEELHRRVEESEATVRRLRGSLASEGGRAEAQDMLDTWERATEQTLTAQAEWARRWLQGWGATPGHERQDDEGPK